MPEDTLIEETEAPCELRFEATGVVLGPSPTGEHTDPGKQLAQSPDGTYFTANATGFPGIVSHWDANGKFIRNIGRPGNGPGELSATGALMLFMGGGGTLHVRDGGITWNVFSPAGDFVSKTNAAHISGVPGTYGGDRRQHDSHNRIVRQSELLPGV